MRSRRKAVGGQAAQGREAQAGREKGVSEFLAWVPLIIIFVVAWIGSGIITAINTANFQRHEDHLEMMERLAEIASDISDLNGTVDGLGRRYDPPDLSAYD